MSFNVDRINQQPDVQQAVATAKPVLDFAAAQNLVNQIGKLEKAYERSVGINQELHERLKNLGKGELSSNVEVLAPFAPNPALSLPDLITEMNVKKSEIEGKIESLAYRNIELIGEVEKMTTIRKSIAEINSQEKNDFNAGSAGAFEARFKAHSPEEHKVAWEAARTIAQVVALGIAFTNPLGNVAGSCILACVAYRIFAAHVPKFNTSVNGGVLAGR
jgi:hypothetical protein